MGAAGARRARSVDPRGHAVLDQREDQFRELFRPFAPMVLAEPRPEFFELNTPTCPLSRNLHALGGANATGEAVVIPATTHVDGTARADRSSRRPALAPGSARGDGASGRCRFC
jgi:predicted NodU family carbamoyl transferase